MTNTDHRVRFLRRRGFVLVQLFVVISVTSLLLIISANRRLARLAEVHSAYIETAVIVLAQTGVDAAITSIHNNRDLLTAPLGHNFELTGATADLEVAVQEIEEGGFEITSCASVRPTTRRATLPAAMHCVRAWSTVGPNPVVQRWVEF